MDAASEYWRQYLLGDDDAFTAIVRLYNRPLMFYINGVLNNLSDSEDIAADTFLELVTKRPDFRCESSFKTYLFAAARHKAIDFLRSKKNRSYCELPENEADKTELEGDIIRDENSRAIAAALKTLPADYREALQLIYFFGMSHDEAAKVLHKNAKQFYNIVFRAKAAMKVALKRMGIDNENQ